MVYLDSDSDADSVVPGEGRLDITARIEELTGESQRRTGRLFRLRGAMERVLGEMRKPPPEW